MSRKGLKDKDIARIQEIEAKHPADISMEEESEVAKLKRIYEKEGKYSR